jgi:hypothetical protein
MSDAVSTNMRPAALSFVISEMIESPICSIISSRTPAAKRIEWAGIPGRLKSSPSRLKRVAGKNRCSAFGTGAVLVIVLSLTPTGLSQIVPVVAFFC